MFSEGSPPLQWDEKNNYTREAIELYYKVSPFVQLLLGLALLALRKDNSGPFASMCLHLLSLLHVVMMNLMVSYLSTLNKFLSTGLVIFSSFEISSHS